MRLSLMSLALLYGNHLQKPLSSDEIGQKLSINMQEYPASVLIFANQAMEADLQFWQKVMQACNVSSGSYSVILLKNQTPIFNNNDLDLPKICLLCALNCKQLLSFGIRSGELFLESRVRNFSLLSVPETDKLRENQAHKRALWNILQRIIKK